MEYKQNQTVINSAQKLSFENKEMDSLLAGAYYSAIDNLLNINTVNCDEKIYNRTGLLQQPEALMLRAGGDYNTPWTRDASINSWNAASLLEPKVARNTLWAVCDIESVTGKLIVQRDNQWWDKVIWITGAWSHYLITGNKDFLRNAYEVSVSTLNEMKSTRYNEEYNLFQGPSFFNDGIAGYPAELHQPENTSSFVLDHPDTHSIMALSTNCLYYNAYRCTALMGSILKESKNKIEYFHDFSSRLKDSINKHFWVFEKNLYGYFIYGEGRLKGELHTSQEGMGLSLAIIFGVADEARIKQILDNTHLQPKGITVSWPHFGDLYSDDKPGRHNVITWPLINGFWAHAASLGKREDILAFEVENIASLVKDSNNHFYEIYDSITGAVSGGWQCGVSWKSCTDQTWSATSYIRAIINGVFGVNFHIDKIEFQPCLPWSFGNVSLSNFKYREMVLNIKLSGKGCKIKDFYVDGIRNEDDFIYSNLCGEHTVEIEMKL